MYKKWLTAVEILGIVTAIKAGEDIVRATERISKVTFYQIQESDINTIKRLSDK